MMNNLMRATLFAIFLSVSLFGSAQYYQFAALTQPYETFSDGIELDVEQMNSIYFDTIYSEFEVSVLGQTTTELIVHENFIWWERSSLNEATQLFPLWYLSQIVPNTSISYKTVGLVGNRILKVQFRNLGFLNVTDPDYFTNFQVWFYEGEDQLEFHYGPRNIVSSNAYLEAGDGSNCPGALIVLADVYNTDETSPLSAHVFNTPLDPQYEQFFSSTTCAYQGMPNDGDVYRFYNTNLNVTEVDSAFEAALRRIDDHTLSIQTEQHLIASLKIYSTEGKVISTMEHVNQSELKVDLQGHTSSILIVELVDETGQLFRCKIQL